MATEELLPCAHCGHDATLLASPTIMAMRYFVKCDNDGCGMATNKPSSEEEAVAMWNLRTRPDRSVGVGELEAALRGFIMDLTGSLQNRNTMLTINHDALVARIEQGKAAIAALKAGSSHD